MTTIGKIISGIGDSGDFDGELNVIFTNKFLKFFVIFKEC